MVWSGPQDIGNTRLYNPALIHDHRVVTEVPDDPQIVTDEQQRQSPLFLEFNQQIEDLCLDTDVQCCYSLVTNEQLWIGSERAGDHNPLPLSA